MEMGFFRGIEPEGKVTLHHPVVKKVLLDQMAFVAEAEYEFLKAVMGIDLHDVPENRLATDFHQRFWPELRLFPQPGSHPPAQNDNFHFRRLGPFTPLPLNNPGKLYAV
jgi:hypothetical protein